MSSRRCNWKKYGIPGVIAALLTVSLLPAPTYTYVVRELSQTFTAIQTFSQGFIMSGASTGTGSLHLDGGIGATAGNYINLEGSAGDTRLKRDPETGFILVYVDGSLKATITPRGVIAGDCASDLYVMEAGTECYDTTTHKKMTRDERGVHEVGK